MDSFTSLCTRTSIVILLKSIAGLVLGRKSWILFWIHSEKEKECIKYKHKPCK